MSTVVKPSGTIQLDERTVDQLFKDNGHQVDVALAIYKMVFPNWDDIVSIDGWPSVNSSTANKLMGKFIKFDRVNHPTVFAGGLWMNKGFSIAESPNDLRDYEVDLSTVKEIELSN